MTTLSEALADEIERKIAGKVSPDHFYALPLGGPQWTMILAALRSAPVPSVVAVEKAAMALERARTVLGNMAAENEGTFGAFFGRWPIHHEPLRGDAKRLLPVIDDVLALLTPAETAPSEALADELSRPTEPTVQDWPNWQPGQNVPTFTLSEFLALRSAPAPSALSEKEVARRLALAGLAADRVRRTPPHWEEKDWQKRVLECIPGRDEAHCREVARALLTPAETAPHPAGGDGLDPPGCPMPGMCSCPGGEAELAKRLGNAAAEIERLQAEVARRDADISVGDLTKAIGAARLVALEEAALVAEELDRPDVAAAIRALADQEADHEPS